MQTSTGDDGDAATALLTKAALIFLVILPFSVYKSHPKIKSIQTVSVSPPTIAISTTPVKKPEKTVTKKKETVHHF